MVDEALSQNQISGLLLVCYENERPLQGMIAYLDWRFDGVFTRLIQSQVLTGALGESVYQPVKWNEATYHFVIVGGGYRKDNVSRAEQSKSFLTKSLTKLEELQLQKIGISTQDWDISEKAKELEKRGLCVLQ